MKQFEMKIGDIPAILYGSQSEKIFLFVHGQNGNKEEAWHFGEIVTEKGWQVLSIDLPEHGERKQETGRFFPWVVVPELQQVWAWMSVHWRQIALRADSIGAWFSMLAFGDKNLERSLLVSPILDMERLIADMMGWAGVTEDLLESRKTISTTFGQTLSWEYWQYAKQHPVSKWNSKTKMLYGSQDNLTGRDTVDRFVQRFNVDLTVMDQGEHWFHTEAQLSFLDRWVRISS